MELRRIAFVARGAGLAGCLALMLWGGISLSGETRSRAAWQAEYQRPNEIPFPRDNPYSEAKSRLGRMLFFEPMLSSSQSRSCATCHNPGLSWSDGLARGIGEMQSPLPLRTPTLLNVAWTPKPGWDGHFRDLEAVAFGPITAPNNMNVSEKDLIARLSAVPGYVSAFHDVFGDSGITRRTIELALATFQRSIVSSEAPFDRWIKGDERAINDAAKRGFDLFNNKANCSACHSGWAFTDSSFHDIGVGQGDDIGRGALFPNSAKLRYAFKTPTLRDVARRAPYMHDGSLATLEAVIDLYDRGGIARPSRSDDIKPLGLTQSEKADLVAFMGTLTGAPVPTNIMALPR